MLSGKLAFVTGGGSGIGRATCQVLAREGSTVVIVDINEAMAKETLKLLPGVSHSYCILDVTDKKELESAVQGLIGRYKSPPTIVVNCAGIYEKNLPSALESEEFDKTINVNVKGTLNVIQALTKEIIKHKLPGSIINIGSIAWCLSLPPEFFVYAASKAAVHSITKAVAKEMGEHRIRCNVIHPGLIETPLSINTTTEEFRKEFSATTALKRSGQPQEVGEVVAFLASEKSSYVTGAAIEVSGGL